MKLKISLILLFSSFILIGINIRIKDSYKKYIIEKNELRSISNYINNDEYKDYLGILEIPKINLKKAIKYNTNVNNGIAILDIEKYKKGNIIFLSHSGNCDICYFNRLDELNIDDEIYVYKNQIKYIYKIYSIEEKIKNTFKLEDSINSVTLITCKKNTDNIQIIIQATLEKYY